MQQGTTPTRSTSTYGFAVRKLWSALHTIPCTKPIERILGGSGPRVFFLQGKGPNSTKPVPVIIPGPEVSFKRRKVVYVFSGEKSNAAVTTGLHGPSTQDDAWFRCDENVASVRINNNQTKVRISIQAAQKWQCCRGGAWLGRFRKIWMTFHIPRDPYNQPPVPVDFHRTCGKNV